MRALLIHPPISRPGLADLALEILADIAQHAGWEVAKLFGQLHQPDYFTSENVELLHVPGLLSANYFGVSETDLADALGEAYHYDFSRMAPHHYKGRSARIEDEIFEAILAAQEAAESAIQAYPAGHFDVVAITVSFDAQKVPAAVMARAAKRKYPNCTTVAGGSALNERMGPAFLEHFPDFDYVVQGDAEVTWRQFLDKIEKGHPDPTPGLLYRTQEGTVKASAAPPLAPALIPRGAPDYREFFDQCTRKGVTPYLTLESSRGCWWGHKHQCRFCGIAAVSEEYRTKDPEVVFGEIEALWDQFQPPIIYFVDAILPRSLQKELLPRIRDTWSGRRDSCLFYEVKSNLKRKEIRELSDAHVWSVQPGIESLSQHSLDLMGKGVTVLQQINFLKWATAYGIRPIWSLLCGFPGESSEDIGAILELIPSIEHLAPPAGVNRMLLYRESPLYEDPTSYGLRQLSPLASDRVAYQCDEEQALALSYKFHYEVESQDDEWLEAMRRLQDGVDAWQASYRSGHRREIDFIDGVAILRTNHASATLPEFEVEDDPVCVDVLRSASEPCSIPRLSRRLNIARSELERAAEHLLSKGSIIQISDRILTLPIPVEEIGTIAQETSRRSFADARSPGAATIVREA